jgi:hypothetical protein
MVITIINAIDSLGCWCAAVWFSAILTDTWIIWIFERHLLLQAVKACLPHVSIEIKRHCTRSGILMGCLENFAHTPRFYIMEAPHKHHGYASVLSRGSIILYRSSIQHNKYRLYHEVEVSTRFIYTPRAAGPRLYKSRRDQYRVI